MPALQAKKIDEVFTRLQPGKPKREFSVHFLGNVRFHAEKARIDAANGLAFVAQQFLEPALRADAQICLFDVGRRQRGQTRPSSTS